jgi:type II secretory pathway component PulF
MTSRLERKWWFAIPVSAIAAVLTLFIVNHAGIRQPYSFSQWVLFVLAFGGLQRGISLVGWLLVLALSPADKVLERTR